PTPSCTLFPYTTLFRSALVQLQLRAHHDHRASRVVHALAEQVLTEAPALALDHVGERLQGALVGAGHRLAAAAVVQQRVDRFLEDRKSTRLNSSHVSIS